MLGQLVLLDGRRQHGPQPRSPNLCKCAGRVLNGEGLRGWRGPFPATNKEAASAAEGWKGLQSVWERLRAGAVAGAGVARPELEARVRNTESEAKVAGAFRPAAAVHELLRDSGNPNERGVCVALLRPPCNRRLQSATRAHTSTHGARGDGSWRSVWRRDRARGSRASLTRRARHRTGCKCVTPRRAAGQASTQRAAAGRPPRWFGREPCRACC